MFNRKYVQNAINELTRSIDQPREFYRVLNRLDTNGYLLNKYNEYYYLILEKISENLMRTANSKSLNLIKDGEGDVPEEEYNGFYGIHNTKNLDVEDSEILADFGLKILKYRKDLIIKDDLLHYNMKQRSLCNYFKNLSKIIITPTDKIRYLDLLNLYIQRISSYDKKHPNSAVKQSMKKKICSNLRRIKYQYLLNDAINNSEYYSAILNFKKLQTLSVNEFGFDGFKFEADNYFKFLSLCVINHDTSNFRIAFLDLTNQVSDLEFRLLFLSALKSRNYFVADLLFQSDITINEDQKKQLLLDDILTKNCLIEYLEHTDNYLCFLKLLHKSVSSHALSENEAIYRIYSRSINKTNSSEFTSEYCVKILNKLAKLNLDLPLFNKLVDFIISKNDYHVKDLYVKIKRNLIRQVHSDTQLNHESKKLIYLRIAESIGNHKNPKLFYKMKNLNHLMKIIKDEPNNFELAKFLLFESSVLPQTFKKLNMEESERFFQYGFFHDVICPFFNHTTNFTDKSFKRSNRLFHKDYETISSSMRKIMKLFPAEKLINLENIILRNAVLKDDILFLDHYLAVKIYNITDTEEIKDIICKIIEECSKYGKFEGFYYTQLLRYYSISQRSDFDRSNLVDIIMSNISKDSQNAGKLGDATEFEILFFSCFRILARYYYSEQRDVADLEEWDDGTMSDQELEESVNMEQRIETMEMTSEETDQPATFVEENDLSRQEKNLVRQEDLAIVDKIV